ncbi:MAG: DUF4339 domain-containing protein [Pseudomonadota bacterium]
MQYYYINKNDQKDGPHDLVTMMRRIRSGVIVPDTMIYQEAGMEAVPAFSISELSPFFNNPVEDVRNELEASANISLLKTFKKGWRFTLEHQGMSVFAGAILLASWMFGKLADGILHNTASSIMASWIMFIFLQSCFFAVAIRLYRGQKTDLGFLEHTLAPVIGKISFAAVLFSFAIIGALPVFIFPGVIAMLTIVYIPMFILDYNYSVKHTITSIYTLLGRMKKTSFMNLCLITLFYMIAIAFIIPIPIAMPIMAGCLCSIYEELSTA